MSSTRRLSLSLALVAIVAVLAACTSGGGATAAPSVAAPSVPAPSVAAPSEPAPSAATGDATISLTESAFGSIVIAADGKTRTEQYGYVLRSGSYFTTPALSTRVSSAPRVVWAAVTAAVTAAADLTSAATATNPSASAASRLAPGRSSTATRAPRSRIRRATARPIPEAPPVTSARRPSIPVIANPSVVVSR